MMNFSDIPQFTQRGPYSVNMSIEHLIKQIDEWEECEGLQLNPDFQRGHVWTEEQQIRFMEFFLRGGYSGRELFFNRPGLTSFSTYWNAPESTYNDFVCVDELQRITAIRRFLNDEIPVFGQKYSDFGGRTNIVTHNVVVNINNLKTKDEVLQWYIEMNDGGTPHTKEEIDRVRSLIGS